MRAIDLSGKKWGELTAVSPVNPRPDWYKATSRPWLCQCSCGRELVLPASDLNKGAYTHCGCATFTLREGMRFGNWTVLDANKTNPLCICDCGLEKNVRKSDLVGGRSRGCRVCGYIRMGYNQAAGSKQVFSIYRKNASTRGKDFRLSLDEAVKLFESPCHYCGRPPSNRKSGKHFDFWYNGIDRKENSLGYYADNVVPCCYVCNRAKREMGYDEFLLWIEDLISFNYATQEQV